MIILLNKDTNKYFQTQRKMWLKYANKNISLRHEKYTYQKAHTHTHYHIYLRVYNLMSILSICFYGLNPATYFFWG